MSWGSMAGMGGGVGQGTVMADTAGQAGSGTVLQNAGEASKGMDWKKFAQDAGKQLAQGGGGGGGGSSSGGDPGSGSTLEAKRPIGEHPEATHLAPASAREGFSRLNEIGPRRAKTYGQP